MAATRLIPMHVGKGRSLERSLKEKTEYAKNPDKRAPIKNIIE